jgi:phage terminase large subunit-like protein
MAMNDRITDYALRVCQGDVVAGKPHIEACQRHLKDLERQGKKDFPYIWTPEKALDIVGYAETLTIIEGFNPKQIKLYGSQAFDLGATFGWIKSDTGFRRFRRKYESKARQNGKTLENAIQMSYVAGFSGYKHGKLYTAATRHAQAKLPWEEIAKFLLADSDLSEYFDVKEYKSLITAKNTGCTIEAVSRERSLLDGFRPLAASIDEIHQHPDNGVYKALYNGSRLLPETLISMITTRGKNLNSFCHEMDTYAMNILNGSAVAEDFFVDIYTLDKEDKWFDESLWIKANPILMQTDTGRETMATDAQTAQDMGGSDLSDYVTKCLNYWYQSGDNQYIAPDAWNACLTHKTLESFAGQPCYVGIDLSSGGDLTSIALDFPFEVAGTQKYYIYSHSFMPRGRLEEHIKSDTAPYDEWENEGLITVTGGVSDYKNDFKFIIQHLRELQERYGLKFLGIGYDPHNADGILADLETFGCPLVMITQSARNLNSATEDFRLNVKSGNVEYDVDNRLLTWSIVNAKVVRNSFKEIKIDKEPLAKMARIDPVDAIIDAHALAMRPTEAQADVNAEMERYLKRMAGYNG